LKLLEGKKKRGRFKVALVYIDRPRKKKRAGRNRRKKKSSRRKPRMKIFSGQLKGRLLTKVKRSGAKRLPYEKIFVPDGKGKTIVQMSFDEKNRMSHRGKAARKFARWFNKKRN